MELGFIGLGKMGMNMVQRLRQGGHQLVAYDLSPDLVREAESFGCVGAKSLVPVPTLTAALFTRFRSRQEESFAEKMWAAMRKAFGGHAVRKRA